MAHMAQMARSSDALRILIVDDNLFLRQQLRKLLLAHSGWEVCGEATDGFDAIEKTRQLVPDMVVMDLSMPVMNGLRAAREIRSFAPKTPVLMFSMYLSPHFVHAARDAGARGVVSKSQPHTIVQAIEELLRGNTFFAAEDRKDSPQHQG
jgi:two-component system nitrate/nitrite response regulator NarL